MCECAMCADVRCALIKLLVSLQFLWNMEANEFVDEDRKQKDCMHNTLYMISHDTCACIRSQIKLEAR